MQLDQSHHSTILPHNLYTHLIKEQHGVVTEAGVYKSYVFDIKASPSYSKYIKYIHAKFGDDQQNVKTKGPMALENVGSFQYIIYKRYQKKKSGSESEKKQLRAYFFVNYQGPKWPLKCFAYLDPCTHLYLNRFIRSGKSLLLNESFVNTRNKKIKIKIKRDCFVPSFLASPLRLMLL